MKQSLSIAIRFSPHYKIHISVSDPFVFQQLKDYLETHEFVTFQTRGKRKLLRKELKITKLWEKISEDTLSIDAGFVDYLYGGWLRLLDKEYYDISLDIQMPTIHPVSIIEKWEPLLRDNQKEDIRALTRFYGGLSSQHTGYGKTRIMLAIVESLLPERCLILVPSSGILEEVQERGETFGVEIPQYKWTHEVSILNPMGFLRSKEAENSQAIQWLSKVRHVFTDEAHHLQAMSWDQMFSKFLPNVVRSYGFSASPDVKEGQDLSPQTMPIKALGHKNSKILGLSGSIRVTRKSHAEVSVVKVITEITPEIMVESLRKATWQESLDLMLSRPFCAQVIETILARFPDIKFYIPIHKVDTGIQLYKNLQQRGVSGVFWSEKYIFPAKEDKKEADLAFVKHHVLRDTCRFLMTTSVGFEGIDIPALAGIIPLIGTSFRMTIQPAGRSIRGGSLVYVLIYDKHNRLVKKQMDKRLSKMKQEYSELKATRILRIT